MQDNNLEQNRQNSNSKDDTLSKDNCSMGLKQGKNALNLGQCQTYLDKLDPNTKVKVKILDFESFRQFLPLCHKYSSKFEVFKYSTEFNVVSDLVPTSAKTEMNSFKESFTNWLKNQKIDIKIMEILKKEIDND